MKNRYIIGPPMGPKKSTSNQEKNLDYNPCEVIPLLTKECESLLPCFKLRELSKEKNKIPSMVAKCY